MNLSKYNIVVEPEFSVKLESSVESYVDMGDNAEVESDLGLCVSVNEDADEKFQQEYLLFNTLHGSFATLTPQAFEAYRQADETSPFFQELCNQGFLTNLTPEEEFQVQQNRYNAARTNRDVLTLCIAPTYACTCACTYCYERLHTFPKGIISSEVLDATLEFIKRRYLQDPFEKLSIQWYGGEPTVGIKGIEYFSEKAIAWCNERSLAYEAMILTNCNTLNEEKVRILKKAQVEAALITLDGPKNIHNARRPALDGGDSYQRTIDAIDLLQKAGIAVTLTMNSDKISIQYYQELRDVFRDKYDINYDLTKCVDYDDHYGEQPFSAPAFDLFEQEEFNRAYCDMFISEKHSPQDFQAILAPMTHFCKGQIENYYVIDVCGDVYMCDGYMGNKRYKRFNLLDDFNESIKQEGILHGCPEQGHTKEVFADPTCDEACAECEFLPICMGVCFWERERIAAQKRRGGEMPCGAFKTTINEYLRGYRDSFGDLSSKVDNDGFLLLMPVMYENNV